MSFKCNSRKLIQWRSRLDSFTEINSEVLTAHCICVVLAPHRQLNQFSSVPGDCIRPQFLCGCTNTNLAHLRSQLLTRLQIVEQNTTSPTPNTWKYSGVCFGELIPTFRTYQIRFATYLLRSQPLSLPQLGNRVFLVFLVVGVFLSSEWSTSHANAPLFLFSFVSFLSGALHLPCVRGKELPPRLNSVADSARHSPSLDKVQFQGSNCVLTAEENSSQIVARHN